MTALIVEEGRRFGRWTVVADIGVMQRRRQALVRCDCGQARAVVVDGLRRGKSTSCGCFQREAAAVEIAERSARHGHAARRHESDTYRAWQFMRDRCKPDSKYRERYHARGIAVCERWELFENFLCDMGERPGPAYSVDRINNDLGYFPGNCRWATAMQQARNRRSNHLGAVHGEVLCIAEAAERYQLNQKAISSRIRRTSCSLEQAVDRMLANRSKASGATA